MFCSLAGPTVYITIRIHFGSSSQDQVCKHCIPARIVGPFAIVVVNRVRRTINSGGVAKSVKGIQKMQQNQSDCFCTWCRQPDTGRNEKKYCSLRCAAEHNLALDYPTDLSNYDLRKCDPGQDPACDRRNKYCRWCEREEATKAQGRRKYCNWACFEADNWVNSLRNFLMAMVCAGRERAAYVQ